MKRTRFGKLREALWPRMGWRRYAAYLRKRVLRLSASPHAIGAGVASGAAASMFPLIGLHFLLGFVIAFFTRGNMIAAAIGTAWGNPLTFPLFFTAAYAVGEVILGIPGLGGDNAPTADAAREQLSHGLFEGGFAALWPSFKIMMLGAAPLALTIWCVFYFLVRWLAARFQAARAQRRAALRAERAGGGARPD